MKILIDNPVLSTWIFTSIFLVTLFLSRSYKKQEGIFTISITQELKGFAILAIIFSHIGYFLVEGDTFLFPISIFAGVGVNLFLFLSSYGLMVSTSKNKEGVLQFYKKRLLKLYIPFWIVFIIFLLMDYFILKISYSTTYIIQAFSGIFLRADMFADLNSNFWYMTLILSYYILFPLIYIKKYPWISAIILYICTYKIVYTNPELFSNIDGLYKVHLVAFPLGMIFAWISHNSFVKRMFQDVVQKIKQTSNKIQLSIKYVLILILVSLVAYGGYHSGVGETVIKEQTISLLVMFGIICIFLLKKKQFNIFYLFGVYSYPIYLLHWPIVSRYDIFFRYVPAWIALILYLMLFVGLGWFLQKNQEKYL